VTIDLPGMTSEDVDIEVKQGELWVTGERKSEEQQEGQTWHHIELRYGRFQRVFRFGEDVEADKVEATFSDGVLRISAPKAESARRKHIAIKHWCLLIGAGPIVFGTAHAIGSLVGLGGVNGSAVVLWWGEQRPLRERHGGYFGAAGSDADAEIANIPPSGLAWCGSVACFEFRQVRQQFQAALCRDGVYVLRSDKRWKPEEFWQTYMQLNVLERAFRVLKSELLLRPGLNRSVLKRN
jgi:hypothetical protein